MKEILKLDHIQNITEMAGMLQKQFRTSAFPFKRENL